MILADLSPLNNGPQNGEPVTPNMQLGIFLLPYHIPSVHLKI